MVLDQHREALERILSSATFRRSEQLRKFLHYVVTEELDGRGDAIREWDIAVRALGRPESYTPDTDSTVRTRAHALRQKLAEYYAAEGAEEPVRIELPRGGYTPRFLPREDAPLDPVLPETVAEPTAPAVAAPRPWLFAMAGFAGCLVLVAVAWFAGVIAPRTPRPAILQDFWHPMLESRGPVRIVLASAPQLWVRDYGIHAPPEVEPNFNPRLELPEMLKWFALHQPVTENTRLYLHVNPNGLLWGDPAGAILATRFLAANGAQTELIPERTIKGEYVLRDTNVIAFGQPEYSGVVRHRLPSGGFTVGYLPALRRHAIHRGEQRYVIPDQSSARNYGLITIQRDGDTQFICFTGLVSNGAQAAVEYLTSARHLEDLKKRVGGEWPRGLQVVVRVETNEYFPIRTEYESHLVTQR